MKPASLAVIFSLLALPAFAHSGAPHVHSLSPMASTIFGMAMFVLIAWRAARWKASQRQG